MGRIVEVLNDELRPGTPAHFSLEEIIQIVALACVTPQDSQRPANQWTPPELAAEAVKRGIVKTISPQRGKRSILWPPSSEGGWGLAWGVF